MRLPVLRFSPIERLRGGIVTGENSRKSAKGFILLDVLMALAVLAIAMTAFLGGMSRALNAGSRSESVTRVLPELEAFLFDLETGARPDLVHYGGQATIDKLTFKVDSEAVHETEIHSFYEARIRFMSDKEKFPWAYTLFLRSD